jgi:hypothetical protein
MKTEKRSLPAVCLVLLCGSALILPLASCGFFGVPEYELMVTVEEGVKGTPVSGQYVYTDLTEIDYSYEPLNSLHTVEVILDDDQDAAADTLTMYKSMALTARLIDIRGTWTLTVTDSESEVVATPTIVFSGADLLGGTFTDSRGYSGTWTGPSNVITMTYGGWEAYKLTGTIFSMTGTWTNGANAGTWKASR